MGGEGSKRLRAAVRGERMKRLQMLQTGGSITVFAVVALIKLAASFLVFLRGEKVVGA